MLSWRKKKREIIFYHVHNVAHVGRADEAELNLMSTPVHLDGLVAQVGQILLDNRQAVIVEDEQVETARFELELCKILVT